MVELIKGVVCGDVGGSEVLTWGNIPLPRPTYEGQVLIKVKAAGVNRPDILQRQGLYSPPSDASPILGLEVAGVVEQVFGDSAFAYGDNVCALTHGGGYAEYVWVDSRHCLPIPKGWSFVEAAALPETYFTVWFNVFMPANLDRSRPDRLLVHAGGSGIGVAAIQLAKMMEIPVVITARRADVLEKCLALGADAAFDSNSDWVGAVKDRYGNVDAVLDMLGATFLERNISVLAPKGRLIWLAFMTGAEAKVSIPKIMAKQLQLTGSFLRPQSAKVKAQIAKELFEQVWPRIESLHMKPVIEQVFPIQQIAAAHNHLEQGGHFGKIVLTFD